MSITPALIGAIAGSRRRTTGAFTPASVSGLQLWLKADALSLSDNDPVSTWTDSSSQANDATQSGTARPTFKTAIVNGLAIIRFDGTNDYMSVANVAGLALNTSLTIVVGCTNFASGRYLLSKDANAPSGGALTFYQTGASTYGMDRPYVGGTVTSSSILSSFGVLSLQVSGTAVSYFKNGAANGTGTTVNGTNTSQALKIGAFNDGSNRGFLIGDIGELVIYNSAISTADRQAVEDYMGARYGITITH